jgi:predicted transcriptional regulator YdeE
MTKSYHLPVDVPVFGICVKTFPTGIKEAFDMLYKDFGAERDYYGVSWMDESDNVVYYAMARELNPGEAMQKSYERLTIAKGQYAVVAVENWMSKTDSIKDIFHELMGESRPDKARPCIEWYQSDHVMLCMIKADEQRI